jgi:hypothetical protein
MKKVFKNLCILFIVLISENTIAQHVAAFNNFREQFYIFDKGKTKLIEGRPIVRYEVGLNYVVYKDANSRIKIYDNGEVKEVDGRSASVDKIYATDYLVVFTINGLLYVYENNEIKKVSNFNTKYEVGDSIIAFVDGARRFFEIYYNGKSKDIDEAVNIVSFKAGDNIVAWLDRFNVFKVFYQNEIYELPIFLMGDYKASKNLVVYNDQEAPHFKAFWKGEEFLIDHFSPKEYKLADNMVAYIDNMDSFKVLNKGKTTNIFSYPPNLYDLKDSIMVFADDDFFNVFYQDRVYQLENFTPQIYKLGSSIVVYKDLNNRLSIFENGERKIISYEPINYFEVYGNLVVYNVGVNEYHFYYNGKKYD